jgi:predicted nucleic acid-binding protein
VIVADTSAILALIDADDAHHRRVLAVYEQAPERWVLPWAILPEVDYMLLTHVGAPAQRKFLADLAAGSFAVEWGDDADLSRANDLCQRHKGLRLGLVDATVAAVAERLGAAAIATLDLRHFGALKLDGAPVLLPRDA